MKNHKTLNGLYLITNDDNFEILIQKIHAALDAAPVALLQYRRKQVELEQQYVEIEQMKKLCERYQTPLIINDSVELASYFQVGLHLGQKDGALISARVQLGAQAIIGRTCHASLALAEQAQLEGADYLAFGAVYPSTTKPNAERVSLETLAQAKQSFDVPICAIGGLTVDNSQPLIDVGVDLFAVVGEVFNLPTRDISTRVKQWTAMLSL